MILSSMHAQTGTVISPSRPFIAGIAQGIRVVVRTLPNLAVHAVFSALDRVEQLAFSPNGSLVLAVVPSQGVVHVWSVDDQDWHCRIDAGLIGVSRATFHPTSSQNILVWSDFNLRLEIWNINSGNRGHLNNVKGALAIGVKYAALVSRNRLKDAVQIVNIDENDEKNNLNFSVVQCFLVPGVGDLAGLVWTSSGTGLVAFESCLSSRVHLIDLKGQILCSHNLYPDSLELGVKVHAHSRTILALGCFDQTVRIFSIKDSLTFLATVDLKSDEIHVIDDCPVVLRETLGGEATLRERNMYLLGGANKEGFPVEYRDAPREDTAHEKLYVVKIPGIDRCTPITSVSDKKNAPVRGGVIDLEMSPDGAFLAAQTDEKSSVIFLLDVAMMKITNILIHRQPVRCMRWNPSHIANKNQLAVVTGDCRVLIWNPTLDNRTVEMNDPSFQAQDVQWTPDGTVLLVADKEKVSSVQLEISIENYGG